MKIILVDLCFESKHCAHINQYFMIISVQKENRTFIDFNLLIGCQFIFYLNLYCFKSTAFY